MSGSNRLIKQWMPERLIEQLHAVRLAGVSRRHRIVYPYTHCAPLSLLFLEELARRAIDEGIPGDFVECGVYKGGSAGVLGYELMRSPERRLWLFDSFAGMPPAGEKDEQRAHDLEGKTVGSKKQTKRIMKRIGVPTDRYELIVGLLEETLPGLEKPPVALLHVDTDFYAPVKLCLEQFHSHIAPGGYVVVNDYGWFEGARKATDEFLAEHEPDAELIQIDNTSVYYRKPMQSVRG